MAVRTWPSAIEESNVTSQAKETDSRILIDEQLRVAERNLADKSQVLTKVRVTAETFAPKPSSPPTCDQYIRWLHVANGTRRLRLT